MAEKGSTTGNQNPTDNPYDLDKIDPSTLDPALVPIYNSMLADYRQKTTVASEMRKGSEGLQEQYAAIQKELGTYQERLKQWEAFGNQVQPIVEKYNQGLAQQGNANAHDGLDDVSDDAVYKAVSKQYDDLAAQIAKQNETIQNYANQFVATMGMQDQLGQLRNERGEVDTARVFEVMKKLNTADMSEAAKLAYYDEDREAYATKYAEEKLEEAKRQWEADHANAGILPGPPGGPMPLANFRIPVDAPANNTGTGRNSWSRTRMKLHQALSGQPPEQT